MELKWLVDHTCPRSIWQHIEDILESGFQIDEILDLGEPCCGYFSSHLKEILDLGANPIKLFYLIEDQFPQDDPLEVIKTLTVFLKHGLERKVIARWIRTNFKKEDIVLYGKYLLDFGINPERYKKYYLESKGFVKIWDEIVFGDPPDTIKPDDVIRFFSLGEVEKAFTGLIGIEYNGTSIFIKEFKDAGGTIDFLADKALREYGYTEDEEKLSFLATLVREGSTLIDPNRIIDSLTYRAYAYNDPISIGRVNAFFHRELQGYADEKHLAKLKI